MIYLKNYSIAIKQYSLIHTLWFSKISSLFFAGIIFTDIHPAWAGFKLTTLVVMGTDSIGSCKSNYHTITATTAPNYNMIWYFLTVYFDPAMSKSPKLMPNCLKRAETSFILIVFDCVPCEIWAYTVACTISFCCSHNLFVLH
jgi:hypothetical protein